MSSRIATSAPAGDTALLALEGVAAGYGRSRVLHGVNATVNAGEIVALIGRNGAGKSTCLRAICGLLRTTSGRITFAGDRIDGLEPHRIASLGIAHVREGRRLFLQQTVHENLLMGAYLRRDAAGIRQDVEAMFDTFPVLRRKKEDRASLLSGGEQQMLALAQGLMLRPKLILLDEPSLGLAPIVAAEIFATIARLRTQGVSVLLVEQMVKQALTVCDRAYVLDTGAVTIAGTGASLLESREVQNIYLGVLRAREPASTGAPRSDR